MSSIENAGLALNPKFPSVPVLVHWNRHEMPTADKHLVGPYWRISRFNQNGSGNSLLLSNINMLSGI